MSWDPKRDYGPDEYFKDVLGEGPVKDVCFTGTGIIKEYENGNMTIFDSANNAKGHNSYTFTRDSSGNLHGSSHNGNT